MTAFGLLHPVNIPEQQLNVSLNPRLKSFTILRYSSGLLLHLPDQFLIIIKETVRADVFYSIILSAAVFNTKKEESAAAGKRKRRMASASWFVYVLQTVNNWSLKRRFRLFWGNL